VARMIYFFMVYFPVSIPLDTKNCFTNSLFVLQSSP
jgi:hypothetical protein